MRCWLLPAKTLGVAVATIDLVMSLELNELVVNPDDQPGRNPLRNKVSPLSLPSNLEGQRYCHSPNCDAEICRRGNRTGVVLHGFRKLIFSLARTLKLTCLCRFIVLHRHSSFSGKLGH